MHPSDCPDWEYKDHPDSHRLLPALCDDLLKYLQASHLMTMAVACDTRPAHRTMFVRLTPVGHDYYAGNYRGSEFRCLRCYQVGVRVDPRVGLAPGKVRKAMEDLASETRKDLRLLDAVNDLPASHCKPNEKLASIVVIACRVLERFLTIHPYANGNGHMGRLMVWAVLWRYDYWFRRWPLNDRPAYSDLLSLYRDGQPAPLEQFVLSCL
jgi:hypothetical protein